MTTDRKNNTIVIASDHNGLVAKSKIIALLTHEHYRVIDLGPYSTEKVDYVDYANQVGKVVSDNCVSLQDSVRGILICGTGIGMSIAANRHWGARASLVTSVKNAKLTREHNNSNILVMGSWNNPDHELLEITTAWLNEPFGEGRHVPRVQKLERPDLGNIVVVPGYFDTLRPLHVKLLQYARSIGKVVVLVDSDTVYWKRKAGQLPDEKDRMKMLWYFCSEHDEIVLRDKEDISIGEYCKEIGATHIVKGANFTEEFVREHDQIPEDVQIRLFQVDDADV